MQPRSAARYLAPIALAVALAGTYIVIHNGLTSSPSRIQQAPRRGGARHRHARRRFYVVGAGENLTGIAARTGVPVGQIEALNPKIDPNSLQSGLRLRLRR